MFLNATVIVQIFHFFIAYFIINQLLLKPAVLYIFSEQQQKTELQKEILNTEQKLNILNEQKQNHWQAFQEQFKRHIPSLLLFEHKPMSIETPKITLPNLAAQKKIITDLTNQIIQKVNHVR